jgi:hypothetical protein
MTTLSADALRTYFQGDFHDVPAVAGDIIYGGAAVGDNGAGYGRPLVSGDAFLGFADYRCDNAAGTAGAVTIRTRTQGVIELPLPGLAITDIGRPVYASDDAGFNITGIGSYIGRVCGYVSSAVGMVRFDAAEPEHLVSLAIPIALAGVSAADVVTDFTPGFAGRIKKLSFTVTTPVTTGAKAATLNAEVGSTNLTGGVIPLTSANCTPLGAVINASAITAGAAFTATDAISIEASSVTAFAEGAGVLTIVLGQ